MSILDKMKTGQHKDRDKTKYVENGERESDRGVHLCRNYTANEGY
jgi:hypothetical protein